MEAKILLAYGTKAGSTAEIANFMAQTLRETGASVDVLSVQEINDLSPYAAVILGTATRIGKPLGEVVDFAKKHAAALQRVPVAYFVVGITMREDTPEHRHEAEQVLEPLSKIRAPIGEGLFAGKVEYASIEQPWRFIVSHDKEGDLREGDWRDWQAIRDWTLNVASVLVPA